MTKTCTGPCARTLDESHFGKNGKLPSGKQRYRAQCKECSHAWQKDYRAANPEVFKDSIKRSYEKNKEAVQERHKIWNANNRDKTRAYAKKWQEENRDKKRESRADYRARIRQQTRYAVPRGWWTALKDFYGEQCMRCGSTEALSLDHVVALENGGWHEFANWQLLCAPCNSSKRDRHSTDYRPWPKLVDRKVS